MPQLCSGAAQGFSVCELIEQEKQIILTLVHVRAVAQRLRLVPAPLENGPPVLKVLRKLYYEFTRVLADAFRGTVNLSGNDF